VTKGNIFASLRARLEASPSRLLSRHSQRVTSHRASAFPDDANARPSVLTTSSYLLAFYPLPLGSSSVGFHLFNIWLLGFDNLQSDTSDLLPITFESPLPNPVPFPSKIPCNPALPGKSRFTGIPSILGFPQAVRVALAREPLISPVCTTFTLTENLLRQRFRSSPEAIHKILWMHPQRFFAVSIRNTLHLRNFLRISRKPSQHFIHKPSRRSVAASRASLMSRAMNTSITSVAGGRPIHGHAFPPIIGHPGKREKETGFGISFRLSRIDN
jgi:hypothetical protein